ncbi:MAG TPA: hypothetical protein VKA46_38775 [Gemmataceae bacterium]|nr:hypothetical protein [Gemmataceae bacterium]
MRTTQNTRGFRLLALVLLCLAGCDRRKIEVGPGDVPLSEFSANVSAGDLLDPATAESRLALYLDELAAAGYKKQIRIILPPDWGPRIYEHWFPVIRGRGFKVLAILGQERRDSAADADAAVAWVKHVLPLVHSDLMGIQIVNEPAYTFSPGEYAAYHRRIAPLVRQLAPGVPIVAGDFGVPEKGQNSLDVWKEVVAAGASDYDVLSIHVTGSRREGELKDFAARLRDLAGPGRRVWITEGDWGQLRFLRQQGVAVEETFIYTWNDDALPALVRRPGGKLP